MSAEESEVRPPRTSELSKVPSWILLGFALGALFVLLFKFKTASVPLVISTVPTPAELVISQPSPTPSSQSKPDPTLTTIEAVWASYGSYAVWEGDLTEVAVWNAETKTFRDCFEVMRLGDQVYFRTITHLTRPLVDRGLGASAPIRFTGPASVAKSR